MLYLDPHNLPPATVSLVIQKIPQVNQKNELFPMAKAFVTLDPLKKLADLAN
jgi:hypothetical protein